MARVERFTATGEIPVEQAQLIPGFPADVSSAEALRAVAGTVEVFAELAIRKQAADDSLAVNAAGESRTLAELEMQQFMIDNPDPDDWERGLAEILSKQSGVYSSQKFLADTKEKEDIRQKAFINRLTIRTSIATTAQSIENNITLSGKNLIDLISNDDGSPEDALNIKEQIEDYEEALERKYEPKIAALMMEETLREGQKLQVENIKKDIMNRAAVRPEQVKVNISIELKARKKGKKPFEEFALLSNIDLEAIRDYANSVGDKIDSDSKVAVSAAIEDSYAKIISGDTDVISMITAIQTDPTISDDDSNNAVVKIKTFFSTWNSAIDAKIVTSDSTRIKALKIISDVRTADITEDEGLTQYIKLSKVEKINGIDGKGFINDIFTASKSAEKDPLNTTRARIYFGNLEILYKDVEIDALEFDKMHTALRDFFDQDPPPTPEQASKFYEELISPVAGTIIDRILNFLVWPSGTIASRILRWTREGKKGKLPEPGTLTEFEDTVRLLDKEEAKAYYEEWKDKW